MGSAREAAVSGRAIVYPPAFGSVVPHPRFPSLVPSVLPSVGIEHIAVGFQSQKSTKAGEGDAISRSIRT